MVDYPGHLMNFEYFLCVHLGFCNGNQESAGSGFLIIFCIQKRCLHQIHAHQSLLQLKVIKSDQYHTWVLEWVLGFQLHNFCRIRTHLKVHQVYLGRTLLRKGFDKCQVFSLVLYFHDNPVTYQIK